MKTQDNYRAWDVKEEDFPRNGSLSEKIDFLIRYGILAPSTFNTQPWVFKVKGATLNVMANTDLHLRGGDPTGRNMVISLGTCAFNIQVAAAYFGLSTEIAYIGTSIGEWSINIKFKNAAKPDKALVDLFPQITKRYSEKRALQGPLFGDETLEKLRKNSVEGTRIYLVNSRSKIAQLADLVHKAAAGFSSNRAFAQELSAWMRSNNTAAYDGMPGFSSGVSTPQVLLAKAILKRTPRILKPMAKKYFHMVRTSPAVGAITTPTDTWKDWVRAGIAYERLALAACAQGISLSPMSVVIEGPERSALPDYFVGMEGYPQMFYRLVRIPSEAMHTPRRIKIEN